MKSNLLTISQAKERKSQNEKKILSFLLSEKYSNASILSEVVGVKTRSGICKILRKMEARKLLKRHVVNPYMSIWGITNVGLHEAQIEQDKVKDWSYFEPSKVNVLTLNHQFDIQKIHSVCLELGLDFISGRELGSRADSDKIADGIIQLGDYKIAVEVERHVKSKRRYDAVIYNYLKLIKSGVYNSVLYVCPDESKTEQVKKAMHSLEKITMKINGRNKDLLINPEIHLSYFDYVALDEVSDKLKSVRSSLSKIN